MGKRERELLLYALYLFFIWLSWKGIVLLLGEQKTPIHERYFPVLSSLWEGLYEVAAQFILWGSKTLLVGLGHVVHTYDRTLWIESANGVIIGNYCIGFQLIYYFAGIVAITSMPIARKVFGALMGIVIVFVLNFARIAGLAVISLRAPKYLFLAHDHLFNILVFGTMLLFFYFLVKKPAKIDTTHAPAPN